jgi:preprotein translocase subunit SecG
VLFGAYSAGGYWWFMQVLWLKTAINMLFTFGYFGTFQWHLWVHLTLAISVCLMVLSQPHTSRVDYVIELFVLLCLAAVTHVSSIFKSGEEWGTRYLVATAVLAFLPLITTFSLAFSMRRAAKSDAEKADEKRQANAEYEISDDMSWGNEPELREKFALLTVPDLLGVAVHFNMDRKKLEEIKETDTVKEKIIALLEEQLEKEAEWQKGTELEEEELNMGSTKVAAEAAAGGCFASIAACVQGGDDED